MMAGMSRGHAFACGDACWTRTGHHAVLAAPRLPNSPASTSAVGLIPQGSPHGEATINIATRRETSARMWPGAAGLGAVIMAIGGINMHHMQSARTSTRCQRRQKIQRRFLGSQRRSRMSLRATYQPNFGSVFTGYVVPVGLAVGLSLTFYPIIAQLVVLGLDATAIDVVRGDVSQYMQNFFNYNGLLFSFFACQTYSFLYQQQESTYNALYNEVSQARSLLEQLTLVSQGRQNYRAMLKSISDYAAEILLGVRFGCPPAVLVGRKPVNDPLESILYLTSIGVPSAVYDTVRGLRQARGVRLGASQRKLPEEHFALLYLLGALVLFVFPLLGSGLATFEPDGATAFQGHVLSQEAFVFASLAGGVVLTLRVIEDLRSPTEGIYTVDSTLEELVEGLKEEVDRRIQNAPEADDSETSDLNTAYDPLKDVMRSGTFGDTAAQDKTAAETIAEIQSGNVNAGYDRQLWSSMQPLGDGASVSKSIAVAAGIGLVATVLFPAMVELLKVLLSDPTLLAIREDNAGQWLQNFFAGVGFIFSLFVAQTFAELYGQQEAVYLALYSEVTEAKALLEQVTLVSRARMPAYGEMLRGLSQYVKEDLRRLDVAPARLSRARSGTTSGGRDDPLESILYLTSVGEPSQVYGTVQSLRQVRGERLGAVQRKLPDAHFQLLAVLGVLELTVFPVLAAGCAGLDKFAYLPGHILWFQSILFGVMCSGVALTLIVINDICNPLGDTYNLGAIVAEMVSGLEQELDFRLRAGVQYSAIGPNEALADETLEQRQKSFA